MMRQRYVRRTGKRARSVWLDAYCQSTGRDRKYAIKVPGGEAQAGSQERRSALEGDLHGVGCHGAQGSVDVAGATVWQAFFWGGTDVVAGLVGAASRRVGGWRRIAKISAAQSDRELAPYRSKERRRHGGGGTLAAMQREIAVRCEPWRGPSNAGTFCGPTTGGLTGRAAPTRSSPCTCSPTTAISGSVSRAEIISTGPFPRETRSGNEIK